MSLTAVMTAWLGFVSSASAQVAPECEGIPKPDGYDEQTQQDFLQNYVALATSYSPIHGPIPHAAGHGAFGVDLLVIPPLSCSKRMVLEWTKTEETNKTPVAPRLRATYAFPAIGKVVPYAGFVYVPPLPAFGTVNVITGGEVGVGVPLGESLHVGGRFHAQQQKTVGDIATAFNPDDPPVADLYLASTYGLDLMAGVPLGAVTPYVAVGFIDAATFFLVGDDAFVGNNLHPYFGPAFSLGADGLVAERIRWGAEFYGAPGGYSLPDKEAESVSSAAAYGHIYTGRLRVALEL